MEEPTVTVQQDRLFDWTDYLVFACMLAVSALIGLYHGCRRGGKQQSSAEFLVGSRQLGTVPVALSMLASFLSSITLMGQPAEVFLFGPQLWLFGLASFAAIPLTGYVLIPMYHKLQLTSAFEYIGRRFNRWLQLFASTLFSLQMVLYLALVLYAPALALHQVTGINTEVVVTVMYIVCIFYTTIGGMKAVVWTDTFQVLVLYSSMLAVLWKGTSDLGGFSTVWQRNAEWGRTDLFNWSLDPTERYTVWGTLVGAAFLHCAVYGVNQLQVQRYLAVPTVQAARNMLWINAVGWTFVVLLTVYAGMLIFAKYHDCDPLQAGVVDKPDQLFPLFVMDILGNMPGFPGLFVAGIFSAGLSTVSTGVNSLAAIWLSEINGVFLGGKEMSEKRAAVAVKLLALGFGLASFFLVFLVPYMGGLVPVAISLSSFFSGALLGVFLLGMFVPWANTCGVTAGLVAGVLLVGGMTVGSQVAAEAGHQLFTPLPSSTAGCDNSTLAALGDDFGAPASEAFILFRVSFLWYSLIASVCTVVVGLLVSLATRGPTSPARPSGSRLLGHASIYTARVAAVHSHPSPQQHKTESPVCGAVRGGGIVNEAYWADYEDKGSHITNEIGKSLNISSLEKVEKNLIFGTKSVDNDTIAEIKENGKQPHNKIEHEGFESTTTDIPSLGSGATEDGETVNPEYSDVACEIEDGFLSDQETSARNMPVTIKCPGSSTKEIDGELENQSSWQDGGEQLPSSQFEDPGAMSPGSETPGVTESLDDFKAPSLPDIPEEDLEESDASCPGSETDGDFGTCCEEGGRTSPRGGREIPIITIDVAL